MAPTSLELSTLGHRIRHQRVSQGLTLDELGELVGVAGSQLSLVENGKREPKLSLLQAIATATGVELDAIVIAAPAPPEPGARPSLDAKAAAGAPSGVDPRVAELLKQAWRHAKAIGALSAGKPVLDDVGIPAAPGVVTAEPTKLVTELTGLLATHRVWQRFEPGSPGTAGDGSTHAEAVR